MEIYSIGFTRKKADAFFSTLRDHGIKRLIDVRLNNVSQLAGFSKRDDLQFFLRELCGAEYIHEPILAPTKDILDAYKKQNGDWSEYEQRFLELMAGREIEKTLSRELFSVPTILLCSEPTAERCHRRLVLEYLNTTWGDVQPVHL